MAKLHVQFLAFFLSDVPRARTRLGLGVRQPRPIGIRAARMRSVARAVRCWPVALGAMALQAHAGSVTVIGSPGGGGADGGDATAITSTPLDASNDATAQGGVAFDGSGRGGHALSFAATSLGTGAAFAQARSQGGDSFEGDGGSAESTAAAGTGDGPVHAVAVSTGGQGVVAGNASSTATGSTGVGSLDITSTATGGDASSFDTAVARKGGSATAVGMGSTGNGAVNVSVTATRGNWIGGGMRQGGGAGDATALGGGTSGNGPVTVTVFAGGASASFAGSNAPPLPGGLGMATARGMTFGAGAVTVTAISEGGEGGTNAWGGDGSADGGGAAGEASGQSTDGPVTVSVSALGGMGGQGYGAKAGDGGSVILTNAVSGSTSGSLSLSQSATGGAGGFSGSGPGGHGGRAASALTLVDDHAASITGVVSAQGGASGFIGVGPEGSSGAATSSISLTSSRVGALVDATAKASSGDTEYTSPGDATATAVASSVAHASATARAQTGSVTYPYDLDTLHTGLAMATATANSSADGALAKADAVSLYGAANATATSGGVGPTSVTSDAQATGLNGAARAQSTAAQGNRSIILSASAPVDGATHVQTTGTFDPSQGSLFADLSGTHGLQAYAFANGALSTATANDILAAAPNAAARLGPTAQVVLAGSLGANTPGTTGGDHVYSASVDFVLPPQTSGEGITFLGLAGLSGYGGGFESLSFTLHWTDEAHSYGTDISKTFTTLADAESFFSDKAILLGSLSPSTTPDTTDVSLDFELTAHGSQGAGLNYFVAQAVPEPPQWALGLAALITLVRWAHAGRRRG